MHNWNGGMPLPLLAIIMNYAQREKFTVAVVVNFFLISILNNSALFQATGLDSCSVSSDKQPL